jgi:hypothetical protein
MMGQQMTAVSIMGYDKLKDEYISLWMDSMSTGWSSSHGKKGADRVIDTEGHDARDARRYPLPPDDSDRNGRQLDHAHVPDHRSQGA